MTRTLLVAAIAAVAAAAAIAANVLLLGSAAASNDPVGQLSPRVHLPAAPPGRCARSTDTPATATRTTRKRLREEAQSDANRVQQSFEELRNPASGFSRPLDRDGPDRLGRLWPIVVNRIVRGREQSTRAEARRARPVESLLKPQPSDPPRRRRERRRVRKRVERADEGEEHVERRVLRAVTHRDSGESLELLLQDRARDNVLGAARNRGPWNWRSGGRETLPRARRRRAPARQLAPPQEADDKKRTARSGDRDLHKRHTAGRPF